MDLIQKSQILLDSKKYSEGIDLLKNIDFNTFNNEEGFNIKYRLLDILYMLYYWNDDINGCQETLKKFEYCYIDAHIIENSNYLFILLRKHGYKIIGTNLKNRISKDAKEVIIHYGNYYKDYKNLPIKNNKRYFECFRHPYFYNQIQHDSFEGNECWNKVDKLYILNLEERQDRYIETLNELCKMEFPLNKVYHFKVKREILFPNNKNVNNGAASCTKNHILILEDMIKNNYNNCIIMEDDFTFSDDYENHKNNIKIFFDRNYDFDITFLAIPNCKNCGYFEPLYKGSKSLEGEELKEDDLLNISKHKWTTTAGYIVNKKTVQKVLNNFKEGYEKLQNNIPIPIDANIIKLNKIYFFKNKLGYQRINYSDIVNKTDILWW